MLAHAAACKADNPEATAGDVDARPPASLTTIPFRRGRPRLATVRSILGDALAETPREDAKADPHRENEPALKEAASLEPPEAEIPAPPEPADRADPTHPSASDSDVLDFWKALRGDRRLPSWTELDMDRFAESWPHSLLLRFPPSSEAGPPRLEASFTKAMRDATARVAEIERPRIDYTPQLTEWVMALSREVARSGRPMTDEQTLPSWRGRVHYRAVALPFSEDLVEIDHVLCHVELA